MFIVLDIYLHLQQLFDYPYPTLNKNQENTARFGFLVLNETMCLFYKCSIYIIDLPQNIVKHVLKTLIQYVYICLRVRGQYPSGGQRSMRATGNMSADGLLCSGYVTL